MDEDLSENQWSRSQLYRLIARNRNRIQNEINADDNNDVQAEVNNENIAGGSGIGMAMVDMDSSSNEDEPDGERLSNDGERLSNDGDDVGEYGDDDSDFSNSNDSLSDFDLDFGELSDGDVDVNVEDIDGDDGEFREVNNEIEVQRKFQQRLATWVRTHNISCVATEQLLKMLRENGHLYLPESRPTLLRTPKTPIVIKTCFPGRYYHFGLKKCLRRCNYSFLQNNNIVEIDINIDGVSLSKSSKLKMWPILGAFPGYPNTSPFLIGCYEGYADPNNVEVYLQEFVEEMTDILINGAEVTPQLILKPLKIRLFSCDMPGRSFVKGTKGHTSLFGCDRCTQKCYHVGNTMVYQPFKESERTDDTFRNRLHQHHHQPWALQNPMLIEELNLGLVSQFVIDDMHAVHLGVMRKMILCIFKGHCNGVRLTDEKKQELDSQYISYAPFIPVEFARRPRSIIMEGKKWKAAEFRLFLLYAGIVFLRDSFGPNLYQHFLLLSISMRFLSSIVTYIVNDNVVEQMLYKFVTDFSAMYDPKLCTYVVHSLLHVQEDVRRYGPIGTYSAYRFENHQRELKKDIKSPTKILQQMHNRIEEINIVNEINVEIGYVGRQRPRLIDQDIFPGCNSSYRGFKYGSFTIETNIRDSCCLLNSNVPIEVKEFFNYNGEDFIVAKKFVNARDFFTEPLQSSTYLGILLVDPPNAELFYFKREEVKYKFMRLPYKQYFVLIPILHHLD